MRKHNFLSALLLFPLTIEATLTHFNKSVLCPETSYFPLLVFSWFFLSFSFLIFFCFCRFIFHLSSMSWKHFGTLHWKHSVFKKPFGFRLLAFSSFFVKFFLSSFLLFLQIYISSFISLLKALWHTVLKAFGVQKAFLFSSPSFSSFFVKFFFSAFLLFLLLFHQLIESTLANCIESIRCSKNLFIFLS